MFLRKIFSKIFIHNFILRIYSYIIDIALCSRRFVQEIFCLFSYGILESLFHLTFSCLFLKVKDMVKDELTVSLKNYQGLLGTNVESLLWNGVMREV